MPLSSQFSLSLELTKLLPLGSAVNATGRGLIQLARELQKSGSDIVVEEDLAEVFGRNRVTRHFESTFRAAVRESKVQELSGYLDIVLESGAGPTVRRSLQDRAYFSMVVQLSLLAWSHEIDPLSRALATAIERRLEDAPPEKKNFPSYDGILGTLQACRDQTSQFRWDLKFAAVEQMLGITTEPDDHSPRRLPFIVLQGFLDFLFAVQSLPDDRWVHIIARDGYATVVVWAHHVLGLNVTVQAGREATRFGQGREHILFELVASQSPGETAPTICLLDANADEDADIFRLSTDEASDVPLNDDIRAPAYGYGRICLERELGSNQQSLVRELAHKAVAYAWNAFQRFARRPPSYSVPLWRDHDCTEDPLWTRNRILEAGRFLFAGLTLDEEMYNFWVEDPEKDPWTGEDGVTVWTLEQWLKAQYGRSLDSLVSLKDLSILMGSLTTIVGAFSMLPDLESCGELPLRLYSRYLREFALKDVMDMWTLAPDARRELPSFNTLARLLLGSRGKDSRKLESAALVSSHGWSIYLTSIGLKDPEEIQPNVFRIACGVPTRSGERKYWILDAVRTSIGPESIQAFDISNSNAEHTVLRGLAVKDRKVFVGTRGAAFEATLTLQHSQGWLRIGYRSLQELRRSTRLLPSCDHGLSEVNGSSELRVPEHSYSLDLNPDMETLQNQKGRVYLAMTGGDRVARWVMMQILSDFSSTTGFIAKGHRQVKFLRASDCCLDCAINYAKDPDQPTFVTL